MYRMDYMDFVQVMNFFLKPHSDKDNSSYSIFQNLIVCYHWTQNHIDRKADISISCAAVDDRFYQCSFYLIILRLKLFWL